MSNIQNPCYNCFSEKQDIAGTCPYCGYDNIENREKYPTALKAGSILNGQYIVGRVLGQGGFGITYLALDYQLNVKVAIKEYIPDGMATRLPDTTLVSVYVGEKQDNFNYGAERFLDEARVLAKFIGNKNIAGVKSYFNENNTAYFVMDYIEGISFKSYIKNKGGRVDYVDALRVLMPVMDALAVVHREGLIHRDVTPDNIYITKDNETKLLDFGSARYSLGDKSKSLDVILKAGYAPKEQYIRRGKQGSYTDIYSLAACFYASITGYLPPEALERMEEDEIVPISTRGIKIPDNLENAIMKGLEVRAEDRWQSVEEFKAAIEGADVSYGSPVTANASPVITSTAAGERVSVWQTTGQQFSGQYEQPLQYTAGQPVTAEHQNMQVNPPQTPQEKSPDPIENKTITFWRKNKFAMIISAVACFLLVFSIIRTIGNNSGNGGSFVPVGNSEGNSNENDYVTNLQSDDTIEIPTPIAIEPIEIIAGEYYPESFESIFNEISNILSISLEINIISPYNEFQSKIETSVSAGERSMFFGYYGDSDIENLRALGATVIQPNNYSYAYFIITPWIEEDIAVQIINEFEKITASIHVKDKEFSASSDSPAGKYSGDMLNGNRDGYGEMIYSNGGTYAGDWKDDLYNGHGILISPSGSQYEGEFVNGLPNGIGTLTSVEGDRYFENLIEGEYSNLGTETKADGTTGEAQSNSGESASSDNAAADKVNADKKAADKVAADKAKADKAAADLSALDEAMEAEKDKALKGRADKAAADKAAADKAAADKAAADKAAADKAAAEKAAAEKAANAGEYSMTFSGKTYKYIASSGNPLTFSDNSYSAYFQREDEQGKYNSDNYIILYLPENVSTGNSYKSDLSYYNKLVELTLNGKFYHLDESFSKEYSKDSILSVSGYYVNYSTVYISEWGGSGGTCKGTFEAQIELDTGDFIDFTGSFNCKIEGNGFN